MENIYDENDATKKCRNYPNPDFHSYKDCDDHFMKDYISSFDPPVLIPIWLTDDMGNVTKHFHLHSFGKYLNSKFTVYILVS